MKVSIDPWESILSTLEPDWKKMQGALAKPPTIKPTLLKKGRRWHIKLEEIWPAEAYLINWTYDEDQLQILIDWTNEILQSWKNCKRESWDMWSFNTKRDAEKFITYYNIACPQ